MKYQADGLYTIQIVMIVDDLLIQAIFSSHFNVEFHMLKIFSRFLVEQLSSLSLTKSVIDTEVR